MKEIVGAWKLENGYTFSVYDKHPSWLRKKIVKWLLNWDYVKAEE